MNTVKNGVCVACGREYYDIQSGACPSDDCPSNDASERRAIRRSLINEFLQIPADAPYGMTRAAIRFQEYFRFGYEMRYA